MKKVTIESRVVFYLNAKKKGKKNRLEKKCNKYRNNAWTLAVLYLMFCGTITCARSTK